MNNNSNACTLLLYFGIRAYLFSPDEGLCYIFSTRNNCCEILASYGVIIQSVIQPFLKTPVSGASLSHSCLTVFAWRRVVPRFFDPKQLLRDSCILWCYYPKCYSIILQNASFWCFIVIFPCLFGLLSTKCSARVLRRQTIFSFV